MVSDSASLKISFLYCDLLDWGSSSLASSYLFLIMGPQGLTSYSCPLLDGSMELSASSSHPVLTSLGLVTSVLHVGSCYVACSASSIPILPKLCPEAVQSQTRQNCIPHSIFSSVSHFVSLSQRRAPVFPSLFFYHLFFKAQLKIR